MRLQGRCSTAFADRSSAPSADGFHFAGDLHLAIFVSGALSRPSRATSEGIGCD
jgi:hypothetical protein